MRFSIPAFEIISEKISNTSGGCHATAAGLSPARFHVHFKRMTGSSPKDYWLRLRVERAAKRLRESRDLSIDLISLALLRLQHRPERGRHRRPPRHARGPGAPAERSIDAVSRNACGSPLAAMKLPSMARGDFDTHFSLSNMLKDSRYALELAEQAGLDTPAIRTVSERMAALCERGLADRSSVVWPWSRRWF